ncbi:MAG: DUF3798 domain-containing protein [Deltaproteobacteria bacterium]|jgi:hypothetical protein|nr:DUF3798 domain-containing protein [Deltaproteobacteria bacterium]
MEEPVGLTEKPNCRRHPAAISARSVLAAAALALAILFLMQAGTERFGAPDGGGGPGPASVPVTDAPFRVAVVTSANSCDDELMLGMDVLYDRFGRAAEGGYVQHVFFPETSISEPSAASAAIVRAAEDPEVMAVVVTEGVEGTAEAFRKIRAGRPEVKLMAAESREDIRELAETADLSVNSDYVSLGYTIPWAAKAMGAGALVHVSFPRHMAVESSFRRRVIMEEASRELGLRFSYENAPDPTAEGGLRGAEDFVGRRLPLWLRDHGADSAFFTTSYGLAAPIISGVIAHGGYFVETDETSPFMGFPRALEITQEVACGDRDRLMRAIERRLVSMGAGGRLGAWTVSARQSVMLAMTELAILSVTGRSDHLDAAAVDAALDRAAPEADWHVSAYSDAAGPELRNVYLIYQDTYVFGRGPLGTRNLEIPARYRAMASSPPPPGAAGEGGRTAGAPSGELSSFGGRARGPGLSAWGSAHAAGPAVLVITGSRLRTPQERQGALEAVRARGTSLTGARARHLAMPDDVFDDPRAAAAFIENAASDPALKALVVSPAPRGSGTALYNLRSARPGLALLTSSASPSSPPAAWTAHVSLVPDMRVRGALMPAIARGLGASSVIHVARDPWNLSPDEAAFDSALRKAASGGGMLYALAGPDTALSARQSPLPRGRPSSGGRSIRAEAGGTPSSPLTASSSAGSVSGSPSGADRSPSSSVPSASEPPSPPTPTATPVSEPPSTPPPAATPVSKPSSPPPPTATPDSVPSSPPPSSSSSASSATSNSGNLHNYPSSATGRPPEPSPGRPSASSPGRPSAPSPGRPSAPSPSPSPALPPSIPEEGRAFFTSSQLLAAALILAATEGGHSFLGSPLPEATEGFPEAFGLDLNPYAGEWPMALKRVEDEATARGASGRLVTWSYPFRFAAAAGLTHFALLIADGNTGTRDLAGLLECMERYTPGAGWNGTPYAGTDGAEVPGSLAVWQDTYILGSGYVRNTRTELPEGFAGVRQASPPPPPALPGARPRALHWGIAQEDVPEDRDG